jgi:excisionase family DNA binding protein
VTVPALRLAEPATATWPEPWLCKRDLAAYLGFSVRWVELQMQAGMPHKRIGGRVRFRRSDVEAWLDNRARRTA